MEIVITAVERKGYWDLFVWFDGDTEPGFEWQGPFESLDAIIEYLSSEWDAGETFPV